MTTPLRFFFDYLSPYAYLAWTQAPALAARHGRELTPVPILFAALLSHHGSRGPAQVPPRRLYVMKDAIRLAHGLRVPLAPPLAHPFNSLLALRVSSLPLEADARRRLIDGLYAAVWAGSRDVADPAEVARIAGEAGLDGPALVEQAGLPEAKERLKQQTAEALALGAFGIPTLVADGELFFGLDSLPHLERFLRGEDPIDPELLRRWEALPVGAR